MINNHWITAPYSNENMTRGSNSKHSHTVAARCITTSIVRQAPASHTSVSVVCQAWYHCSNNTGQRILHLTSTNARSHLPHWCKAGIPVLPVHLYDPFQRSRGSNKKTFTFYCVQASCCFCEDTLWGDVGRSFSLGFHLQPKRHVKRKAPSLLVFFVEVFTRAALQDVSEPTWTGTGRTEAALNQ